MSFEQGIQGDNWARHPKGSPNPDYQISIMNSRAIAAIAASEDRWPLAGDNLYVDLDLSIDNLHAGQRLSIGTAVIELTDGAHNGCHKFAHRFGADAKKFVNSDIGKQLHLRGIFAKVVTPGVIHVGDVIQKV